ncbi:MAG: hypothetical protein EBW37_14605, partial [Rhodobacteraceae bacterium]|nr:hypothetical protein [Paracoccaceae bacterium]
GVCTDHQWRQAGKGQILWALRVARLFYVVLIAFECLFPVSLTSFSRLNTFIATWCNGFFCVDKKFCCFPKTPL